MRLRNVKGSIEAVINHDLTVDNPKTYKGKWHTFFGNNHDIHIEVGMGKGQFIIEMAKKNPHINYIGIEKYSGVLYKALKKIEEAQLENLITLRIDALWLEDVFEVGEVSNLYLNFSDPWPKERHEKRRLTYKSFLEIYHRLLPETGEIHFKTDNQGLFEYSLESIKGFGFNLKFVSRDLHSQDVENVMTEYEEKFSGMGHPINKLIAVNFKDRKAE